MAGLKVTVSDTFAPADMVPLTGRKAHRLADMAGVQRDLRWAAAACAQINRRHRKRNADLMAIEALHDAALIRYGRCFNKGRRDAFLIPRQWINDLPAPMRETHERP